MAFHYAPEFVSADGMGYQAFKKHKERVNSGKKFIRVTTEDLMILLPQEREGKVAIARFIQKYQSSNFKTESNKILYLKKGQGCGRSSANPHSNPFGLCVNLSHPIHRRHPERGKKCNGGQRSVRHPGKAFFCGNSHRK